MGDTIDNLLKRYCGNQSAVNITKNQVFHVRTKHIKVDCYMLERGQIILQSNPYILGSSTNLQKFSLNHYEKCKLILFVTCST